jgi:hypothetical protein
MSRLGILSDAALATHYARARLAILEGILRTTPNGYRASDARFLIGAILWRQGRSAEAIETWRDMRPVATDSYRGASVQILSALSAEGGSHDGALLSRAVNQALTHELGRWVDFSYDRLKQFGYRFDTY